MFKCGDGWPVNRSSGGRRETSGRGCGDKICGEDVVIVLRETSLEKEGTIR